MTPERRAAEVRLTEETIQYLEQRIGAAVEAGIKAAINEDVALKFWETGVRALQESTKVTAGNFTLGIFRSLMKGLVLMAVLAGVVFSIGGFPGVAALWKILMTNPVK